MSDTDATQARQDVVADVDEILEHVINANMLSMPYYVYSELFDAVDGLGVEIENLQAENAKLREELEVAKHDLQVFSCGAVGLNAENAKLRELVRHLRECTRHNVCAACKYADDACDFDYDMRELGVEVDE